MGGRGSSSGVGSGNVSRDSVNNYFEKAKIGVREENKETGRLNQAAFREVEAAQDIYRHLMDAKNETDKVITGSHTNDQARILSEFAKTSGIVSYDERSDTLTIDKGKLMQARREFTRFAKQKFRQYYNKGRAESGSKPGGKGKKK